MKKLNVGIFIPVYFREDKVKKSLNSLCNTNIKSDKYDLKVMVCVGINGAEPEFKKYLLGNTAGKCKKKWELLYIYDPEKNVGKPEVINYMVSNLVHTNPLDYVVSYDSDIIVDDPDWLLKSVEIFENFKGEKEIGALCPNQKGQCCHVLDIDPIVYTYDEYHLITRAGNEGVAGGVLITPYSVWKKFGGYSAHRVYASDDGHYALSCSENNLLMLVIKEVSVIHPGDDDVGYNDWKSRAALDKLKENEKEGYYKCSG